MRTTLAVLAITVFAGPTMAQFSVVIPAGTATVAGSTGNAFPWGWAASGFVGLRHMCIYDASNFTSQNVTSPILINRLRWRPDQGASALAGGTFQQADVRLSTAPMDYTLQTGNFAGNHGPDLATVHSGAVVHAATPGAAAWTPSSWCIDIALALPFLYDPAAGDLVIDVEYLAGSWQGGGLGAMDVQGVGSLAGRTWGSTLYPNANGTWLDHGLVVDVGYVPASGVAYALPYGTGCIDRASASCYEVFAASTFDLANTTLQFLPASSGYIVVPGPSAWFTPVAPALPLGNDAVSAALNLGFPLAYPGGTTSAVRVSDNGFVWAQANTSHGCCQGLPSALLNLGARWCPLWNDLDPAAGGSVRFDTDPTNSAAYVTFLGVPEAGTTNTNTFQIAFFASGIVEFRYQACAVANHQTLTGWSPGANNRDPGAIDFSTALPLVTQPDSYGLLHSASGRPVIGTSITLDTTRVPAGAVLGATLGGLVAHDPGLDLSSIGMPGCRQYVAVDSVVVWIPGSGTGTTPFAIPNLPSLAGVVLKMQSAALVPGLNALGAISSNGLRLFLELN